MNISNTTNGPRRIGIICPGLKAGGTNLLLGRVSMALHESHGYDLTLIDFEDGFLRKWLLQKDIPHRFISYQKGQRNAIEDCDVVIIPILGTKLIGTRYCVDTDTKLIAWCTAPQDVFKFIPMSNLLNKASWQLRRRLMNFTDRSQGKRISSFLNDASRLKGVVFMDQHNADVNCEIFGPIDSPTILPICTAEPDLEPRNLPPTTKRGYWIGRVEDFKTQTLRSMLSAFRKNAFRQAAEEIVIIGHGEDLDDLKAEFPESSIHWLNYLSPDELSHEIGANASFVFGHGTSVLEAAKLGIPALVVDGSYDTISIDSLNAEWLSRCTPGYVGQIRNSASMNGRPLEQCITDLIESYSCIASDCFAHWKRYHSPSVVASQLSAIIDSNDYRIKDFIDSGATSPGIFGRGIEFAKRIFRRNVY